MTRPDPPVVSVVIPVHNGQETLEQCLLSLLRLRYPADRRELIVVDNASTDATPDILRRFDGRVLILRETKRGAGAARNRGIRDARGEFIAFVDADCLVDPDWLTELLPPLSVPGVGVVGGRIRSVQPCSHIERFGERIHDHRRAIEEFVPPYAISMNWASPRALLLAVGLFDEGLLRGQDADLAMRITKAGHRLVYRHEAVVYHRNERTLRGLFVEGYTHGYHAVAVRRKQMHSEEEQYSPFPPLIEHAVGVFRGPDRRSSGYGFLFTLGKALGHFAGLARHGGRQRREVASAP